MKLLTPILLCLCIGMNLHAQNRFGSTNGVDEIIMSGHEYLSFDENNSKFFWAVDMNIFTPVQKSAFQESIFKSDMIISVSVPDVNGYWYLASYKSYTKDVIATELERLILLAKNTEMSKKDKYAKP